MGKYYTQQGAIVYPDQETFDKVLEELQDEDWVDDDGFFTDEDGVRLTSKPTVVKADFSIVIPLASYRNLDVQTLFPEGAFGVLYRTTTDGEFLGEHVIDGDRQHFDLTAWAAEHMPSHDRRAPRPHKGMGEAQNEARYHKWQDRVVKAFHAEFGVPVS